MAKLDSDLKSPSPNAKERIPNAKTSPFFCHIAFFGI
jgi:hypothetical protein